VVNPPDRVGGNWRNLPLNETIEATFIKAVYSHRQLLEVLVDFWHNHFNIFGDTDGVQPVFVHYDRDVIRANALGNFRKMLEDVGTSPAIRYSGGISRTIRQICRMVATCWTCLRSILERRATSRSSWRAA
jgi:Protein of unknown function (DUF1800)